MHKTSAVLLSFALLAGCAARQRFDPNSVIEVRSAALGGDYEQGGQPLDSGDMIDQLGERPASRAKIERARALSMVATVAASLGGAAIGWPAGVALVGRDDPPWVLAGVGAGALILSIPFTIWAWSEVSRAVEAHNESLAASSEDDPEPEPGAARIGAPASGG